MHTEVVITYIATSCNMGTRDLPDIHAQSPGMGFRHTYMRWSLLAVLKLLHVFATFDYRIFAQDDDDDNGDNNRLLARDDDDNDDDDDDDDGIKDNNNN